MGEKKSRGRSESSSVIELLAEVNQLREEIVKLTQNSLALNAVCWYLSTEMGLVEEGQTSIEITPMELARLAIKGDWSK